MMNVSADAKTDKQNFDNNFNEKNLAILQISIRHSYFVGDKMLSLWQRIRSYLKSADRDRFRGDS